jgi:hypothetical protein
LNVQWTFERDARSYIRQLKQPEPAYPVRKGFPEKAQWTFSGVH